ncbi:MAG: membrane dipeptidase, partial [Bryobacteraceae bacterium]
LDVEGGFDLDGDLGVLRNLYRLGVRSAQLPAHNWTNNFADSCCSAARNGGLNEHGKAVVREMNRLGMVINVSHAADETIAQALEVSTAPLIATHHGMRTLNNIPRNMPDDLMRRIAAKGGVIGFHIGNEFHNVPAFDWRTKNAGKPFWDTSEIAGRKQQMTIKEIDRKTAPQFPMVGVNIPEALLFS